MTLMASVSITAAVLIALAASSFLSRPAPESVAEDVAAQLSGNGLYANVGFSGTRLELNRAFPKPCEGAARAVVSQSINLCAVSDARLVFDEEVSVGIVLSMIEGGATERVEYCDGRVIDGAIGSATILWSDKAGFAMNALEISEGLARMQGQCP